MVLDRSPVQHNQSNMGDSENDQDDTKDARNDHANDLELMRPRLDQDGRECQLGYSCMLIHCSSLGLFLHRQEASGRVAPWRSG